MKIRVNKSACTGHTMCNFHAPDVYPLDDDGYNALDGEYDVEPGLEDAARRGALNCPERAIEVIEE